MAKTYRPVDRDQEFLLSPSMVDWLEADRLVWFVIEAVDRHDTTAFHRLARLGRVGRRGYHPDMVSTNPQETIEATRGKPPARPPPHHSPQRHKDPSRHPA